MNGVAGGALIATALSSAARLSSRTPVTPRTNPIVKCARPCTASAPAGSATAIASREKRIAASRLRPQVDAHAIIASASASLTRLPVSLASGRIRSAFGRRPLEIAGDEVQPRLGLVDADERLRIAHAARQSFRRSPGVVVERERLASGEGPLGLLRRGQQVLERLVPSLRLREMMRQHAEVLRQAVGVHLFDGCADARVLRPPLGLRSAPDTPPPGSARA